VRGAIVSLPSELPWWAGDLLSWPDTLLFGGLRWKRFTHYVDDARNPDGRVIEILNPDGKRIYRGESDVCADSITRIDMTARYASGRTRKQKTLMSCDESK